MSRKTSVVLRLPHHRHHPFLLFRSDVGMGCGGHDAVVCACDRRATPVVTGRRKRARRAAFFGRRSRAGPGAPMLATSSFAFYGWRDHEILQVICPTCQNVFRGIAHAGDRQSYFAWGCFRYFGPRAVVAMRAPLFQEGGCRQIPDARRRKARKRVWNYLLELMNSRAIRSAVIVRECGRSSTPRR